MAGEAFGDRLKPSTRIATMRPKNMNNIIFVLSLMPEIPRVALIFVRLLCVWRVSGA